MKLRSKVFIILISMWAIISLLIYIDSKLTLTRDFESLEKRQVLKEIDRTRKAYNNILRALNIFTNDWARWDDAYNFAADKNQKFIQTNVVPTTYENANLNFILFFDNAGKLFYGQAYDLKQHKFVPIPTDLINYLEAHPTFTKHEGLTSSHTGMLKTNEGYIVMTSAPILTSNGKGPIHGALMMGFYWDELHIQKLAATVEMNLEFYPLPLVNTDPVIINAYNFLKQHHHNYITPKNHDYIYGFTLIRDISGEPISMVRIEIPRTLYTEGLMTIKHYLIIVILLGIIMLIAMWNILKLFVLNRVIDVSNQVIDIKTKCQFTDRIKISGNDELSSMVSAMNSLMEIIELTQEQLKTRLSKGTEKLEHLSRLNKNLFAEISHQKAVELKYREEEKLLRQMAHHDELTGLPNRFYFNELLNNAIDVATRIHSRLAILFLDIDKFKLINDTYGHSIGDNYLKHVAKLIKNVVKNDIVARLSGDEFIIFLNNIADKNAINIIIGELFEQLKTPMIVDSREILSTFSIGISLFPDDGQTAEELKKLADLAMYFAKQHHGNTYFYFDNVVVKSE